MTAHVTTPPPPGAYRVDVQPRPPVTVDGVVFTHVGSYTHESDRGLYEWAHYYRSAAGVWAVDAGDSWGPVTPRR